MSRTNSGSLILSTEAEIAAEFLFNASVSPFANNEDEKVDKNSSDAKNNRRDNFDKMILILGFTLR